MKTNQEEVMEKEGQAIIAYEHSKQFCDEMYPKDNVLVTKSEKGEPREDKSTR